jgi:hypothetical protein
MAHPIKYDLESKWYLSSFSKCSVPLTYQAYLAPALSYPIYLSPRISSNSKKHRYGSIRMFVPMFGVFWGLKLATSLGQQSNST